MSSWDLINAIAGADNRNFTALFFLLFSPSVHSKKEAPQLSRHTKKCQSLVPSHPRWFVLRSKQVEVLGVGGALIIGRSPWFGCVCPDGQHALHYGTRPGQKNTCWQRRNTSPGDRRLSPGARPAACANRRGGGQQRNKSGRRRRASPSRNQQPAGKHDACQRGAAHH